MKLFINTSLNHISIRSRLVSHAKNNLISDSEHLFNSMDLLPITFCVILPPNSRGKNSTNFYINPGTLKENDIHKIHTIKILLDSSASASIVHKDVLYNVTELFRINRINSQLPRKPILYGSLFFIWYLLLFILYLLYNFFYCYFIVQTYINFLRM